MITFTWYPCAEPVDMPVRNVSVFAFDRIGRIALWRYGGRYGLPGGRVEPDDGGSWSNTACREAREEISIELNDVRYLGYQAVHRDGERFAQVRMAARIGVVLPIRPDPDGGMVRARVAVPPSLVLARLDWDGDRARAQLRDATTAAHRWWNLRADATVRETGIGPELSVGE